LLFKDRFAFIGCAEVNYNIEIGSPISRSWFSHRFYILVELEFVDVGFCGERKLENPEKKLCSKARTNKPHTTPR